MKIPSPLKSFIYKCDFFSSKVGFRFKQQREYSSLTGGIISLIMIIFFIGIFTNTGIETINKNYIVSSQNKKVYEDPLYIALNKEKNFYFTIGLSGIDMNHGMRYFDIVMTYAIYTPGKKIKKKVPLVACNRTLWQSFNSADILTAFDSFGLQNWLCPPDTDSFQLKGKYTSQQFKFIKIGVQKCNAVTDPTRRCATNDQITDYLAKNQVFTLNYYFMNTILNPEDKQFIKYYLQDKNYFPFTLLQGLNANLFIASYSVETDQSILPNQNIQSVSGGIVTQTAQVFPYFVTSNQYVKFYLRKSNQQLLYTRSFKKIDETLSYIGGLFSSILTFLFVICFYNELSYQLEIAKTIYRYDKQTLLDTNGFHFLNYIVYLIYYALKMFGIQPQWEKMEQYDKSLIEVRKQMDVRLIYKKILFTEKLADAILTPEQLMALHLQDKITILQAQEIRQNYFLPKLLAQQLGDEQTSQKNPLSSRLRTQNNEDQSTSKAFQGISQNAEIIEGEINRKNSDIILDEKLSDIIKQDIRPKTTGKFGKNNKDMITNSISNISQKKNLVQMMTKLTNQEANGNDVSKKIRHGISPQIKDILDFERSVQKQKQKQQITHNFQAQLSIKRNGVRPRSSFKQQQSKKSNISSKSKQFDHYRLKRRSGSRQFKQIKDIIVIQDYDSPHLSTSNNKSVR